MKQNPADQQCSKPVICFDFDDTLCDPNDQPISGARETLLALQSEGFNIVVSSARFSPMYGELNGHRMRKVEEWLAFHAMPVDEVVLHVPDAAAYVDDLALVFDGDWDDLSTRLMALFPHRSSDKKPRRLSVPLESLVDVDSGLARPGAVGGIENITDLGFEWVVNAGALVDDSFDDQVLASWPLQLQSLGFRHLRVEIHKISSSGYVDLRAVRFEGDWDSVLEQVFMLLNHGPQSSLTGRFSRP
ncbi:MAG: hypothetical protein ACI97A_002412 [Planctomycetota bacterium]|jgi:hypothetical protein